MPPTRTTAWPRPGTYYKNTHGRNGIFNDGKGVKSYVHVGSNWVNAAWYAQRTCTTATAAARYLPLTALDIAGHEMSHGVTQATSGLVYSNDAGGLNEANSDIMGTLVEFYANNANDPGDYLIGEKIYVQPDRHQGAALHVQARTSTATLVRLLPGRGLA